MPQAITTLATDISVAQLDFEAGRLAGTGDLTVTGTLDWTGGAMEGTGTTTIAKGATLDMDTGTSTTLVLFGWTHQLDGNRNRQHGRPIQQ